MNVSFIWSVRSSGKSRSRGLWLVTDVSRQHNFGN